jgi:predicted permease
LLRSRALSLTIVATLSIAIGATAAVFAIVDVVLWRGLPFPDPSRLMWIASVRTDRDDAPFTVPELMDFSERVRDVELAAFANWSATFLVGDATIRLQGMRMSGNGFRVLQATPAAGRLLRPEDDAIGADKVVVLSYGLWQSRFAGSLEIVGHAIPLNGERYIVAGVMPRNFPWSMRNVDIVVPLSPDSDPRRHIRSSTNILRFFGRLKSHATITTAQRELTDLTRELRSRYPRDYASKRGVQLTPLHTYLVGDHRLTLVVLLACVGIALVIAIINVLTLLLIRTSAREGELAVRRALGARTVDVGHQLFAEATVVSLAGAALGTGGAIMALGVVRKLGLAVPQIEQVRMTGVTFALIGCITCLAIAIFSLTPLAAMRHSSPQVALLASGRAGAVTRGQRRLWGSFIVTEIALAVMLTAVAATLSGSLRRLQRVDLGFDPSSTFVARVSLPPGKYQSIADVTRFYETLAAAVRSEPGVASAGVISVGPLSGLLYAVPFAVAGRPVTEGERAMANYRAVSPAFLSTVRAALIAGRGFAESDDEHAPAVAIVTRALARRWFEGGDPVGKRVLVNDNNTGPRPLTVVGVINDMRQVRIDGEASADIFIPLRQVHKDGAAFVVNNQFWMIRLSNAGTGFGPRFAALMKQVDPNAATAGTGMMQEYVDAALATRRFSVASLLGFGLIALIQAALGIYGVMADNVERRRREIGVRLAVGATPLLLASAVLRHALLLSAAGVALGIVGALLAGGAIAKLVFGITPGDPYLLAGVSAVLFVVSVCASWIPARRASQVDPLTALRGS